MFIFMFGFLFPFHFVNWFENETCVNNKWIYVKFEPSQIMKYERISFSFSFWFCFSLCLMVCNSTFKCLLESIFVIIVAGIPFLLLLLNRSIWRRCSLFFISGLWHRTFFVCFFVFFVFVFFWNDNLNFLCVIHSLDISVFHITIIEDPPND